MRLAAAPTRGNRVSLMASGAFPEPMRSEMRLLRRNQTHIGGGGQRVRSREVPPAVVTGWLRQGLRSGMCPLCRVAHKADREYIWHFFDEGADSGEAIDEVRAACGFCAEHVEMLRRLEIEGMKSTLATSTMFADTLRGIVGDLEVLTPDHQFRRARCPACTNRDRLVHANVGYLLALLAHSPGHRQRFEASPGLCFPHFELVWGAAHPGSERELLLRVQLGATRSLLHEVSEHVRKHDDKFRHEPKGPERDSWLRAIFLTSGWPPPAETAAEPEGSRDR